MTDRDSHVSEDELHAYVDGELAAARRGAVAAWLAQHPEDAARVAAWQAQADLIRARYGVVAEGPIPARFDLARLDGVGRRWSRVAVAAVIAAFVIGALSGWFGRETWAGGLPGAKLFAADAIDAHKLYVVEMRHPIEVPGEASHLAPWLS